MSKNKTRNKENNQPGPRGMFYYQRKCFFCGKLMWGSSPKNHNMASKNCYLKMKEHQEKHQKEKQLDLSMPGGIERKQTESIKRISLTGEVRK